MFIQPAKLFLLAILFSFTTSLHAQSGVQMSFSDGGIRGVSYQQDELTTTDDQNTVLIDGLNENETVKAGEVKAGKVLDDAFETESLNEFGSMTLNEVEAPATDDYQLPKINQVDSPIGLIPLGQLRQNDPSGLLDPTFNSQSAGLSSVGRESNSRMYIDTQSSSDLFGRENLRTTATWQPPNFYHRPLLFEDPNLERYGNHVRHQNLLSGVKFFTTIPLLPYQIGRTGFNGREYTLHHERPGDYVPSYTTDLTFDRRGGFWQSLVTAAIVIP